MNAFTTILGKSGRIRIPASLREQLDLNVGNAVVLTVVEGELRSIPQKEAVRRAQALVSKRVSHSLVDSLIANRREEAADE